MERLHLCILHQVRKPAGVDIRDAAGGRDRNGTNLERTRIDVECTSDEWLMWRSAGASAATIATVLTHPFDAVKVCPFCPSV